MYLLILHTTRILVFGMFQDSVTWIADSEDLDILWHKACRVWSMRKIPVSGPVDMFILLSLEDFNYLDWAQVQDYRETGWSEVSNFVDPRFSAKDIDAAIHVLNCNFAGDWI